MNSLEFINIDIAIVKSNYKKHIKFGQTNLAISDERRLQALQQIKAKLEIMELIENGWSSIEQTLSGEKIIKFEKLNLDDWLKVWKTLEEIGLKKIRGRK